MNILFLCLVTTIVMSLSGCADPNQLEKEVCGPAGPKRSLGFRTRLPVNLTMGQHAYAHTPWKVIASHDRPEGMDLVEDSDIVGEGTTDDEGWLSLDSTQRRALAQAYCAKRPLWLMYPATLIRLELFSGKPRDGQCNDDKHGDFLCIEYSFPQ